MSIYLECEAIKGNVTAGAYAGDVELLSASFDVSRDASAGKNLEVNRPVMGAFNFAKLADISSVSLLKESTSGKLIPTVKIKFTKTAKDDIETFMEYELSDCLINKYSVTGEGMEQPVEEFSIIYTRIKYRFTEFNAKGKPVSPQVVGYDSNKGSSF